MNRALPRPIPKPAPGRAVTKADDFREVLNNAVTSVLESAGSYCYEATYSSAADPALRLEHLGPVKLPLAEEDARRIVSSAKQAPSNPEEQAGIDHAVKSECEIDAAEVHFDNPAWDSFMEGVVASACFALGVKTAAAKPHYALDRVSISGTGSRFSPRNGDEQKDEAWGTLVVILPSTYTGAETKLKHEKMSTAMDPSKNGHLRTTIMAWHSGVTAKVKPVTGGHQLALLYYLLRTPTDPQPSIPNSPPATQKLRQVLQTWTGKKYSGPKKVVYLLDRRWPVATLGRCGVPRQFVSLNTIVKEAGFSLGFVDIELCVTGEANDWEDTAYWDKWGRCAYDEPEEDSDVEKELDTVDVTSRVLSFTDLVDFAGKRLADTLRCGLGEIIPADLRKQLENGPVDEQQYEKSYGNGPGRIERYYRRSALVLWPEFRHKELVQGDEYPRYVVDFLAMADWDEPDDEDKYFIEYLFGLLAAESGKVTKSDVAKAVCTAAASWGDEMLWKRGAALLSYKTGIDELGIPGIISAVKLFELNTILPKVAILLAKDNQSLGDRCDLLNELETLAVKDDATLTTWIMNQRSVLMSTLKDISPLDAPPLIELVCKPGGLASMKEVFPSLIRRVEDPEVFIALAQAIHNERDNPGDASAKLQPMISMLLPIGIGKTKYFIPKPAKPVTNVYLAKMAKPSRPSLPPLTPDVALHHIQTCIVTGNEALVEKIITKLVSSRGVSVEDAWRRSTFVLLPLISRLQPVIRARPEGALVIPGLEQLYTAAVTNALGRLPQQQVTERELDVLLDISSTVNGGTSLLQGVIVPKIAAASTDLGTFIYLGRQLSVRSSSFAFASESNTTIASLVEGIVDSMVLHVDLLTLSSSQIVEYLSFLHENNQDTRVDDILKRLIEERALSADRITGVLVPLISDLSTFMREKDISLIRQPYATFFRTTILAWCRTVLGPKPPDVSKQIAKVARSLNTCCSTCKSVRTFLKDSSSKQTMELEKIGSHLANHLDTRMRLYCPPNVARGWMIMTTLPGFRVTKGDAVWAVAQWNERVIQGKGFLDLLSTDEVTLGAIFGDQDYVLVLQLIGQPVPPHILASAVSTNDLPNGAAAERPPTAVLQNVFTPVGDQPVMPDSEPPTKKRRTN